jgi:hypothetical protein
VGLDQAWARARLGTEHWDTLEDLVTQVFEVPRQSAYTYLLTLLRDSGEREDAAQAPFVYLYGLRSGHGKDRHV